MKNRKKSFGVFLFAALLLFVAGCTGAEDLGPLPTLAPTHTPVPIVDTPDPTVAPDAEYTRIIELNGEDFNQTSHFIREGEGTVVVKPLAHAGSYSFCLSGRMESWHAVSLDVKDKDDNTVNVSGKNMFMAVWVYHESGQLEDISCIVTAKKPDGESTTIATITQTAIPSNTWTLVQGMVPVYANVTEPRIRFEMTSSSTDFYFDDLRLTYDTQSVVAANREYNIITFEGIYCDFENGENPFKGRAGNEKLTIRNTSGGAGEKCLMTSGRTANWNGPAIDLTEYGLADTTIWVSFMAAHNGDAPTMVKCTIQELAKGVTDESKATYTQITMTKKLNSDEWTEATGQYTLKANTEKAVLYFETDKTEDIFLDNVLITAKDPETIKIDNGQITEKEETFDTSGYETIFYLTADGAKDESSTFINNGSSQCARDSKGHTENGFKVSNRAATWSGVGLHFNDVGMAEEVVGKQVYISFWVYQDSGQTLDFSATLQANKPDGTSVWPERVSIGVLPSGQWTFVEGVIPIYANVSMPQINFEIPTSENADYYLDDVIISYDPNSVVEKYQAYEDAAQESQNKVPLEKLSFGFDDNNAFFTGRGNASCSLEYGGYESEKCIYVSNRTQQWEGIQADFSMYDIFGKTVYVTFRVYHEYDEPFPIQLSVQRNDGTGDAYDTVVREEVAADGKWAQYSGSYYVSESNKKVFFYFETPGDAGFEEAATKSFYIDDVTFEVVEE